MKLASKKNLDVTPKRRELKSPTPTDRQAPILKLEQAMLNRLRFEETHQELFDQYQTLKEEEEVATEEVKNFSKKHRTNLESDLLRVKFQPAFRRWLDIPTLKSAVPNWERLGLIQTTETVDTALLTALIDSGKIAAETIAPAQRKEESQMRCTIERKS